jgi:hypothetical protein
VHKQKMMYSNRPGRSCGKEGRRKEDHSAQKLGQE